MNCSKQYINETAQESGFLANNTEKVIRLLSISKNSIGSTSLSITNTQSKR